MIKSHLFYGCIQIKKPKTQTMSIKYFLMNTLDIINFNKIKIYNNSLF